MKQAASHLVVRKAVHGGNCVKWKAFIDREPDKVLTRGKKRLLQAVLPRCSLGDSRNFIPGKG